MSGFLAMFLSETIPPSPTHKVHMLRHYILCQAIVQHHRFCRPEMKALDCIIGILKFHLFFLVQQSCQSQLFCSGSWFALIITFLTKIENKLWKLNCEGHFLWLTVQTHTIIIMQKTLLAFRRLTARVIHTAPWPDLEKICGERK